MADTISIGEPIPRGTLTRDADALENPTDKATGTDQQGEHRYSVAEQIAALQAEVETLKARVADAGKRAADTVRAYPLTTAALGFAIAGVAYILVHNRQQQTRFSHLYPAIRDRYDRWS
ncbi:MAG: hypothetical protein ACOH2J_20325 [Allorhizobium sp.]